MFESSKDLMIACPCFSQTDPFWTASSLSPSDHREVQNQSICSLAELLELAKGNASLLLNLQDPPRDHPYHGSFLNITLEAVLRSGFPQHQVEPSGWPRLSLQTCSLLQTSVFLLAKQGCVHLIFLTGPLWGQQIL